MLVVFEDLDCLAAHREKYDRVEDRHQCDTDIADRPNDLVRRKSADKQHHQCDDLVNGLCQRLVAEDVGDVGTRVEQNAYKGGEGKQPKRDGDKNVAEGSEVVFHCRL